MVKIGDKVRFNPFDGIRVAMGSPKEPKHVTGRVIDIHEDHKWFDVMYEMGGVKFRTAFNFADLREVGIFGRKVKVVHD